MQVRDLGVMEYGACLRLQHELRDARARGQGEDTILLVEHPAVATLGRRGTPEEVFDKSLPVHVVERGGKATFHGPGQLVVYPIVHLGEGNRDVRAWVQHLEALVTEDTHIELPAVDELLDDRGGAEAFVDELHTSTKLFGVLHDRRLRNAG